MKKRIKLLLNWDSGDETFEAGAILDVDELTANELIAGKQAELYSSNPIAAQAPDTTDATDLSTIVRQAVDIALESRTQPMRVPPQVTRIHDRGDDDPQGGFRAGFAEFMQKVYWADTTYQVDPRLRRFDVHSKAAQGMAEGQDSLGGYLIPVEFRAELLKRTYDTSLVAQRCRRMGMSSPSLQIPYLAETSRATGSRAGGIRGYWLEEAGEKTKSNPTVGRLQLNLHEAIALVYATDQLLQDSPISLNELINTLVADELSFMVDDAIINGSGAGQPLGVLTSGCTVSVAKETGQTASTIQSENILKMWARLYARSRGNAVWFINQDVLPQLSQMAIAIGTGGAMTYMPPGGLSGQPFATLMGRPIIEIEQAATLGTVGDIILADMSQYILAEHRSGMTATTSIHVRFVYDETAFRFVIRVDGQPWWKTALTPYKGTANTVSPFVTLATRA